MLTRLTKTMIIFPSIVLAVSWFHIANGGTMNTDLSLIFMCVFFSITNILIALIYSLIKRMSEVMMSVIRLHQEMMDDGQYVHQLGSKEDLQEFLKELEADILKNIDEQEEKDKSND